MYKSKKYSGVFYNLLERGDKSYFVKYSVNKKQYLKKIGKHSEGIRENFCATKRAEYINEAKFGSVSVIDMGIDDLAERYHNTKTSNATYEDMISRYDFKIKPFFKNKLISKLTDEDVFSFQKKLLSTKTGAKGKPVYLMANSTVNYYVTQVISILNYAVSKGLLRVNVAKAVKPLKENNARERFLEIGELKILVENVLHDEDLLLFVELSMSTGGRMKAVMNLCKKDVSLANRTVSIADEKGKEKYLTFLNDRVIELLVRKVGSLKPNERLYTSDWRRMQRQMKKVLDVLFNEGLEADDAANRVVVHTLRHSFASHLAIKGTPIFTIQKLLNHKDIKQTMRYAKLSPDSGRDFVEGLWG